MSATLHLSLPPTWEKKWAPANTHYLSPLLQLFSHYSLFSLQLNTLGTLPNTTVLPRPSYIQKIKIHFPSLPFLSHYSLFPISCGCGMKRRINAGFSWTLILSSARHLQQSGGGITVPHGGHSDHNTYITEVGNDLCAFSITKNGRTCEYSLNGSIAQLLWIIAFALIFFFSLFVIINSERNNRKQSSYCLDKTKKYPFDRLFVCLVHW